MTANVPSKITLKGLPYGEIEVSPGDILCNDITLPGEFNCHGCTLYIVEIGHSYSSSFHGVWANHDQDAMDTACDKGILDSLMLDEKEQEERTDHSDDCRKPENMSLSDWYTQEHQECCNYSENFARLGNASEAFDLDNVGLRRLDLSKQDPQLLIWLAEARGAGLDNLGQL